MKPPFIRTAVPNPGVSDGDGAALIKRQEFLSVEAAMEAALPEGYTIQSVTDFEGSIVYPAQPQGAPDQAEFHSAEDDR